jgi:hypothetical protein
MAGSGSRRSGESKQAKRGYARKPGAQATPTRRGAGFWALLVGAIVLVIAIVAIVMSALNGTPPAGPNTGAVPASFATAVIAQLGRG